MMSSLDGRTILSRWGDSPNTKEYETTAATFEAQAWLCGRVTMEKDFTHGLAPDLKPVASPCPAPISWPSTVPSRLPWPSMPTGS